jgi:hypothetical protein
MLENLPFAALFSLSKTGPERIRRKRLLYFWPANRFSDMQIAKKDGYRRIMTYARRLCE